MLCWFSLTWNTVALSRDECVHSLPLCGNVWCCSCVPGHCSLIVSTRKPCHTCSHTHTPLQQSPLARAFCFQCRLGWRTRESEALRLQIMCLLLAWESWGPTGWTSDERWKPKAASKPFLGSGLAPSDLSGGGLLRSFTITRYTVCSLAWTSHPLPRNGRSDHANLL